MVRLRYPDALPDEVTAEVALHCGLSGAEDVIRSADARRDVLPVGNVLHGRGVERRHEGAAAVVDRGVERVEVGEANSEVQREAPNLPLILREQAHVRRETLIVLLRGLPFRQ